jgi:hypothetical protein
LSAGLFSCKKESAVNAVQPNPVNSVPSTAPPEITTAYLLIITANADTTMSDTVSISE